MRHDHLYLADIVEAADAVSRFLAGVAEQDFVASDLLQSAVLQKLMVIGEASARLSTEVKASAPHIPWADIIGFRNIVVHAYFNVDWSIVWVAATEESPQLQAQIQSLLDTATDGDDKSA